MEQPRIEFNNLIQACMDQMHKHLKALQALQENEDETKDDALIAVCEEEKAKVIELDKQLKEARERMLN